MAYITPRVRLELGARGDPWPVEKKVIRPYAAEDFPDFFEHPDTTVTVLSAWRIFWERSTALHAEAHRPAESATPQYFWRHYYDLTMMLDSDEGKDAATDLELLATVAKHKATFFRSGWANNDTARPGTLRLMPSESRIKDLSADYRAMASMMFDDTPPSFNDILSRIENFQETFNRQVHDLPSIIGQRVPLASRCPTLSDFATEALAAGIQLGGLDSTKLA